MHLASRVLPPPNEPRRDELFVMQFKPESRWRDGECAFKRWHDNQVAFAQSTPGSTTSFTEIQHRARINNTTRHEFLLVPLKDKSYYRLERTGIGSEFAAISDKGSEAHDMIQWLPPNDNYAWDNGSRLELHLVFSSELDILDILAVCHSIQQHPEARRYKLQTYNCYFFCCAIVSILVRHHASWENVVSQSRNAAFLQCLDRGLHEVLSDPSKSYTFLRACKALHPSENPRAQSLTNKLREMGPERVLSQYEQSPVNMMWWWDIDLLKKPPVQGPYESDLQEFFRNLWHSTPATEEESLDTKSTASTSTRMASRSIFRRGFLNPKAYSCERLISHTVISARANPIRSIRKRIASALCEPIFIVAAVSVLVTCSGREIRDFKKELKLSSNLGFESLGVGVARRFVRYQILLDFLRNGPITGVVDKGGSHEQGLIEDILVNILFDQVQTTMTEAETVVLWRAIGVNSSHKCWMRSIRSFLRDALWVTLKKQVTDRQAMEPRVIVKENTRWGLRDLPVDVFALQDHIHKHIKRYAARVDRHVLGASKIVVHDVETAISDVWSSYRQIQNAV